MWRTPSGGGSSDQLVDRDTFFVADTAIDSDDGKVYFSAGTGSFDTGFERWYYRVDDAGGVPEPLARFDLRWRLIRDLEVAGPYVVAWHVDPSSSPGASEVVCFHKDGGEPTTIARWGDFRGAVDATLDHVAFAQGGESSSRVRVSSLTSGEPWDVASVAPISDLHYDGRCIYLARAGAGEDAGIYVVADGR